MPSIRTSRFFMPSGIDLQIAPRISRLSSSPDDTTMAATSSSFAPSTSRSKRVCWTTALLPYLPHREDRIAGA